MPALPPLVLLCLSWLLAVPGGAARAQPAGPGEHSTPPLAFQRSDAPAPRVVVDPGHGGPDPGTSGDGVVEKDVVLELGREVARRLEEEGAVAFLSRTSDRAVDAASRAAFANYREADLFLSLHVAGTGRPRARGFEIFVAPRVPPGTDPQLWEAGQAPYGEASRVWAALLQARLGEAIPSFDRGITVLPNPTLEAVSCPAVLVELGSLVWPDEAAWLVSREGRRAVAAAVARAVREYWEAAGREGAQGSSR